MAESFSANGKHPLIEELREKIQRLERCQRPAQAELVCSTGVKELDRLFPQGGLAAGTLTEWLSEEGSGAATLAVVLAGRLQAQGGAVVVIDPRGEFYPPAAQALGLSLRQTVVVRTGQIRETLWAWEQSLRSPAVAAALGWLEDLNDRAFRRLQLAAEAGGSVGLLLRPASCRGEPSWAQARFLVAAVPSDGPPWALGRRVRVEVVHGRGQTGVELELTDETAAVRLAAAVGHSTIAPRAGRA